MLIQDVHKKSKMLNHFYNAIPFSVNLDISLQQSEVLLKFQLENWYLAMQRCKGAYHSMSQQIQMCQLHLQSFSAQHLSPTMSHQILNLGWIRSLSESESELIEGYRTVENQENQL